MKRNCIRRHGSRVARVLLPPYRRIGAERLILASSSQAKVCKPRAKTKLVVLFSEKGETSQLARCVSLSLHWVNKFASLPENLQYPPWNIVLCRRGCPPSPSSRILPPVDSGVTNSAAQLCSQTTWGDRIGHDGNRVCSPCRSCLTVVHSITPSSRSSTASRRERTN